MDATTVVVVAGIALLASVAQSVVAFGFGLIVVPFLLLVLDVKDVVVVSSILGLANVALLAVRTWRDVPWRAVLWLSVGSFIGMPLGLGVLILAPQDALRLAVALAAIIMAGALALGLGFNFRAALGELAVGIASGILRTSTSMSGPPVVVYLQGQRHPPQQFRGALTMYFLVTSVASIVAFIGSGVVTSEALILSAVGLPFVYSGSWVGNRVVPRIDAILFRRLVFVILVATALSAAVSSIERLVG